MLLLVVIMVGVYVIDQNNEGNQIRKEQILNKEAQALEKFFKKELVPEKEIWWLPYTGERNQTGLGGPFACQLEPHKELLLKYCPEEYKDSVLSWAQYVLKNQYSVCYCPAIIPPGD